MSRSKQMDKMLQVLRSMSSHTTVASRLLDQVAGSIADMSPDEAVKAYRTLLASRKGSTDQVTSVIKSKATQKEKKK